MFLLRFPRPSLSAAAVIPMLCTISDLLPFGLLGSTSRGVTQAERDSVFYLSCSVRDACLNFVIEEDSAMQSSLFVW